MNWTYEDFTKAVFKLIQIDLSSYKERQMKRRIESLIKKNNFCGYKEYYDELTRNKSILDQFINYITINVSEFYRNPNQWEVLEKDILPALLQKHRVLKVWSAACSTGEEPYSLVMLISKFLPLESIHIIATDIDKAALAKAREGIYSEKSLQSLPKEFIHQFFNKDGHMFRIDDKVKRCVEFRHHDLLKDKFPTSCHLITCRNVMIYFTEDTKSGLYRKFYDALHPDGVLFVGSTEQVLFPKRYNLKSIKTFFYKRED